MMIIALHKGPLQVNTLFIKLQHIGTSAFVPQALQRVTCKPMHALFMKNIELNT